jgi:hypothetical protein
MSMDNINYKKLRQALLNKVGPSGIMPAILQIEGASEEELLELAEQYGVDIDKYINKY